MMQLEPQNDGGAFDIERLTPDDADAVQKVLSERYMAEFMANSWHAIETQSFKPNWHIDCIAEHLEAVVRGEVKKLLINIPPRHSKSNMCSIALPSWVWAQNDDPDDGNYRDYPEALVGPKTKFLFLSYSNGLSLDHSRQTRKLIGSPWYRRHWGERVAVSREKDTETRFDLVQGGYRIASSVGGTATGRGGDIVVVDDPHNVKDGESDKVREETVRWFDEVLPTRRNDPNRSAIIVVMQRVHDRDVSGHIIAKQLGYEHVCLPARYEPNHPHVFRDDKRTADGELLWKGHFDEKSIQDLELSLGTYGSAGQLQQRPSPRSGGYFDKAWFPIIDRIPEGVKIVDRVRSWDLAATKDIAKLDPPWTAGVKMAKGDDGRIYIEHVERGRGNPGYVEEMIRRTARLDGKMHGMRNFRIFLPQDPGSAGKTAISYLVARLAGFRVVWDTMSGDKTERADPVSSQAKAGNIVLLSGTWNERYLDELAAFPTARHKDQVDATATGFATIIGKKKKGALKRGR